MEESTNYTLGHTISCSMNMIHEFSAGVNNLFTNAQDILNDGKGILNTISSIMGSIPGEALHGGLYDSIRECLSRLEACDMGMEGFVLVRKANSYVDNLYGVDSSHAEKVRGCAGYFQSLIQQNIQLYMNGKNGKGISAISQSIYKMNLKGSVGRQNVGNEEEELQRKLEQLRVYSNAYTHVLDQGGRDYYQRQMSRYFNNEIRPRLGEKINNAIEKTGGGSNEEAINAWKEVADIIEVCRYASTYRSLCGDLGDNVDNIINSIEDNNRTIISQEKENIENINIELNKLHELSDEYMQWICNAEGVELTPYRCTADNLEAQNAKTVTLGIGFTFDMDGNHWDELKRILGWSEKDIERVIEAVYDGNEVEAKYRITEEQAKALFEETQNEYIDNVNRNIEIYNSQNEQITYYSQNELEAMFDYAYNNGLGEKTEGVQARDDEEQIIYYYLRRDQENGVNAVIEYGKGGTVRRINQMNLFFEGNYDYTHNVDKLNEIREELGFDIK